MILHYSIEALVPYINWAYFYHAWQLKDAAGQERIRREADAFLAEVEGRYGASACFLLAEARRDGDDLVVKVNDREAALPMLRQQQAGSSHMCMADFFPCQYGSEMAFAGLFATSVDRQMETDFDVDPYQKMMGQLLADRLAEAAAECLHEQVRKDLWGYARDEHLSISEMHQERFIGIRPAVGYPSLPDTSINFLLDDLLEMRQIGIVLTESGAMRPHASVSGLMIRHPKASYFNVGRIGDDQLEDYARRRRRPVAEMRKFLAGCL